MLYLGSRAATDPAECQSADAVISDVKAGEHRPDLPHYRQSDIMKHRDKHQGIWVTYKNGVYDITEFLEGHPGGDKILLAAGGSLEPFWQMYAVHKNPEVYTILEELRIGNIDPEDMKADKKVIDLKDPYSSDPDRHPAMRINSAKPFNSEPPPELLIDNYITPNELFFVRNHLPVPQVDDVSKFCLELSGVGVRRPISLNINELKKKFKQHSIIATVQCAGNRRSHMRTFREVKGLNWGTTAISNAEWTGVKLADVLQHIGAKEDEVNHVLFQGLDKDLTGEPYEASVPAETAFDPRKDVMLVYEMNGQPLPRDHGYPLRVIVPGTVGARQVKWVTKIILSKSESQSHWQQNDYKAFNSSTDWHNVDFSKAQPIQEYPLQSSICEPKDNVTVESGDEMLVKGYAWSGGGRGILRVDVSVDGGKTWHEADLHNADQQRHREWAWTLWEIVLPVPETSGKFTVVCKATDTSHNAQPEEAESIWNLRGLIHNAWHKVQVKVKSSD